MTLSPFNKLAREIGIFSVLAVNLYIALALFTYSPNDPGFTHTGRGNEVVNLGGLVGAWLADAIFTLLGRSGFLFMVLLSFHTWQLLQRKQKPPQSGWRRPLVGVGFALALFASCNLEQSYFPFASEQTAFLAGGIIGQYVTSLEANFGSVGATVLLITVFITGVTLAVNLSWFYLMDYIGYQVFKLGNWLLSFAEILVDRYAGARLRRQRKLKVSKINAELSARHPPTIATRSAAPKLSKRSAKESQSTVFAEMAQPGSLPQLAWLEPPKDEKGGYSREDLEAISLLLVKKLKDFNVDVRVDAVQPGPVITRFEVEPAPGTKSSQIVGLTRDLARSLSAESVRVVDNIAGKTSIGIEIPNQRREIVRLVEGLSSQSYEKSSSPLSLVLGKDIAGAPVITDLAKMPHLLIAGTTGSGKSVCVNALILSILYKATPEQVRLIMVDPKFLELSVYDGIPHLLTPVVTDMNKAANALRWCIGEMDRRFRLMAQLQVRNIASFNKKIEEIRSGKIPPPLPSGSEPEGGEGDEAEAVWSSLPYIVVIVDELADMMMVVGKKMEEIIIRIAQRARAAGIHLVLATQRPSVDVVTGLIKANVPARIAFQVSSRVDSRTVLDQMGAEQLLGSGDMLFLAPGVHFLQRVHGSFISDEEVAKVVERLKSDSTPEYIDNITADTSGESSGAAEGGEADGENDPLYDEAVQFVISSRRASISSVQRALRVGYNRAARMIETMEQNGVVSASDGGKREVLVADAQDG